MEDLDNFFLKSLEIDKWVIRMIRIGCDPDHCFDVENFNLLSFYRSVYTECLANIK